MGTSTATARVSAFASAYAPLLVSGLDTERFSSASTIEIKSSGSNLCNCVHDVIRG